MKKRYYNIYIENTMKGKYKIFTLTPAFSIARDTQCLNDLGWSGWQFYFEWLFFQISYCIETEDTEKSLKH